jgi:hypothetical protein
MIVGFEKSPSTVLHCFLRHCDIQEVCLIPQKLYALYLKLFSMPTNDIYEEIYHE